MRRVVEKLCSFAPRAACSDAERRASVWLHDVLRRRGHEAWVETYWVRPQWAASLSLHTGAGLAASVAATRWPLPAAGAAALAAASLALESGGRPGLLRLLFFRRATQVVVVEPAERERLALYITANVDAPRRGLMFRPTLRRAAARLSRLSGRRAPGPLAWAVIALAAVAAAGAARAAGAEGAAVGVPQLVPTVVLLLALAAAIDAGLSLHSPGANDNATGVAVALAAHSELVRDPPERLSCGLLLCGAGEAHPTAMAAHLRRERPDPAATVLIDVGPCGGGSVAWSGRAGVLLARRIHPQLRAACEWAQEHATGGTAASEVLRRPSAAVAARRRRIPALAVRCIDVAGAVPLSRSGQDVPATIDAEAMERALAFVLAVVDALDADLAETAPAADQVPVPTV